MSITDNVEIALCYHLNYAPTNFLTEAAVTATLRWAGVQWPICYGFCRLETVAEKGLNRANNEENILLILLHVTYRHLMINCHARLLCCFLLLEIMAVLYFILQHSMCRILCVSYILDYYALSWIIMLPRRQYVISKSIIPFHSLSCHLIVYHAISLFIIISHGISRHLVDDQVIWLIMPFRDLSCYLKVCHAIS